MDLLRKAYKVCAVSESMVYIQKCIGDHYRYAYDTLDVCDVEPQDKEQENKETEVQAVDAPILEPLLTPEQLQELSKERDSFKEKALKAYSYGQEKADGNILACNPIRLGITLNYAVFKYEVLKEK